MAQSVILYGIASWVETDDMIKVLAEFHHRAARKIKGTMEKRGAGGEWEYLAVDEAMEAADPYHSVNQEAADNHIGEGGLPPSICTVHGGGSDAGADPDGTLVDSICSK